jgi:hypothetical protein
MLERYNYNDEPSGRSETLVQALDKIERLQKQLDMAETILRELAYGYQSRNQYNKLIAKANGYFKEVEK